MADTDGRARRLQEQQVRARLAQDARLRGGLVRDYQPVWQRIVAQLRVLASDMEAARRAGVTIDRAWVEEWARRHRLERTVREAVGRYVDTAGPMIEDATSRAALAGATDAQRLAMAVGVLNTGLPVEAVAAMAAAVRPGMPLRMLLDELGPTAALRAREQLVSAVAAGLNPRAVAREMRNATALSLARALRIARTETIGAYRRAALARFREHRDVIGGWVWVAKLDGRVCGACLAMHGTVHSLDEDMASHPNCVRGDMLVHGPRVLGSIERRYHGELIWLRFRSGRFLAVTPNHPILTPKGWVAAAALGEGSQVVSAAARQSPTSPGIDPDDHDVPARIDDVAVTLRGSYGVTTTRMPGAAEDFHGDGIEGEINVVRADGLLQHTCAAHLGQPFGELDLVRRDAMLALLAGGSTSAQSLEGILLSTSGLVGGASVLAPLLWAAALGDETVSRDLAPLFDPSSHERPIDHAPAYSIPARESIDRLAGEVGIDEVDRIERQPDFRGHVYNLQTTEGWYVASGIVTHNCRCAPAPVPGVTDTRFTPETGPEWFARQPRETQLAIVGPGKLAAYRDGRLRIEDLAQPTLHPVWGPGLKERALRDVPVAGGV